MPENAPRLPEYEQEQLAELHITEEPKERIVKNGRRIIRQFAQYREGQEAPVMVADMYYDAEEGEDINVTNPFQYINKETFAIDPDAPKSIADRLSTQIIQYTYNKEGRTEDGIKREKKRHYHREYLTNCHQDITTLFIDGRKLHHIKVDVLEIGSRWSTDRYAQWDDYSKSHGKMESTDPKTLEKLRDVHWTNHGTNKDGSKWAVKEEEMIGDFKIEMTVHGQRIRITSMKQLNLDMNADGTPTKAFFQEIEWESVRRKTGQ